MNDNFNLANQDNNTAVFYGIGSGVWQTWQKPRGCSFLNFFVLGGGAGGGAGASAAIGGRSGGAGGGSAAHSKVMVASVFVPDTLHILVGMGGLRGIPTAGNGLPGNSGEISYIGVEPSTSDFALFAASGSAGPTGGGGGIVGSANAAGGAAGTAWATVGSRYVGFYSYLNYINNRVGFAGGSGGNQNQSGTPLNLSGLQSNIVIGGAGGAGIVTGSRNGANVTGSGTFYTQGVSGGNATTLSPAENGFTSFNEKSIVTKYPLIFTGGGGGYAIASSVGGNGGNGAYGCGGGGGGAGITGGSGGNGGDGLVIITWC